MTPEEWAAHEEKRSRVLAQRLIAEEVKRKAREDERLAEISQLSGDAPAIMAELLDWVLGSDNAPDESEPVIVCAAEWLLENRT